MRDTEEVMPTADEWHDALKEKMATIEQGNVELVIPKVVDRYIDPMDKYDELEAMKRNPIHQHRLTAPSQAKREANRKKRKRSK